MNNELRARPAYIDPDYIAKSVASALDEDVGSGDLTAELIGADTQIDGKVIAREAGVLCGCAWFEEVFRQVDPAVSVTWLLNDSDVFTENQSICQVSGPARAILTGERTALNFLQMLSGTASLTRQYADLLAATQTQVLDTRKTIPGLRLAQKYAVIVGGGQNHRIGLFDAVLIKENHISAAGSITEAVGQARQLAPEDCMIEVEVENFAQLDEALQAGASRIMLDNFSVENLHRAVRRVNGRAELEASGNITLANIADYAQSGVDYISIGALTKHVRAIDLSMRLQGTGP